MGNIFDKEEETNQREWHGGYQKLLCRAAGCSFHAASGNWDSPGLCVFHGAIEERSDCWDRMTNALNNPKLQKALWYCQRLEMFNIDRDEKTNPRTKRLYGATEWAQRKLSDTDYLSFHAEAAFADCGLDEPCRGKDEAPRQYGLRIHAALITKLAKWSVPEGIEAPGQSFDHEPVCPELAAFINRGREVMGGAK